MTLIYPYQESNNKNLQYNYQPANKYHRDTHHWGSVSQVLHLIDNKKDLVIAEIGVFRGESSLAMLEYCDVKRLYLIDPFSKDIADKANSLDGTNIHLTSDLFKQTKSKLQKYEDKIVWLTGTSDSVVNQIQDNELDFIFIDGAHDYVSVHNDLVLYYNKVKMGGIISGDDFSNKFFSTGIRIIEAVNDVLPPIGYTEIDVYKHAHKPEKYYSAFAFTKTLEGELEI